MPSRDADEARDLTIILPLVWGGFLTKNSIGTITLVEATFDSNLVNNIHHKAPNNLHASNNHSHNSLHHSHGRPYVILRKRTLIDNALRNTRNQRKQDNVG